MNSIWPVEPRTYQEEAVEAFVRAPEQRLAMQLGTGSGKTNILSMVAYRAFERHPGKRVVFLVHRMEILYTAASTLQKFNPDKSVGVIDGTVTGAFRERALKCDIVCFNTSTLGVSPSARNSNSKRAQTSTAMIQELGEVSLVILDECHHAVAGVQLDCLTELGCFKQDGPKLLGMTATLFREDGKDLGDIFERCAYRKDFLELISEGYLVPPRYLAAMVDGLDLNQVKCTKQNGIMDLNASELDKVYQETGAYGVVAEFCKRNIEDRKTLVFAPNVSAAELVAQELRNRGFTAETIHGKLDPKKRAQIIQDFVDGDLQILTNCMVLTEGTDLPECSCIVIARATRSKILWRQCVGRGSRLYHGKDDSLVIDMVGATTRNDLATISDLDDAIGEVRSGETIMEAATRFTQVRATEKKIIDEELEFLRELDAMAAEALGPLVTGSFNVTEVDPYTEARRRAKKFREQKEKEQRSAARKLPLFPGPDRKGWWLLIGDTYCMNLTDWSNPNTRDSFVAIQPLACGKFLVFKSDRAKSFDAGRYGFVGPGAYDTFEDAELSAVEYAKSHLSAGVFNYRINPMSDSKKKRASEPQINLLRQRSICKDLFIEVDEGRMKMPTAGVAGDYLDRGGMVYDVAKQAISVEEWYMKNGAVNE